jgi:hypothetical protein
MTDQLSFHCHCKGVDFVLRSHEDVAADKSKEELPWFVDPNTHKLLAGFDGCNSCRLASGSDIFHWTFAQLDHVKFNPSKSSAQFPTTAPDLKAAVDAKGDDSPLGNLTYYESSPGVERYFCSRCSATVFYASADRPQIVDIAIGLFDSPDGARAESMLSWAFGAKVAWGDDMAGGWREPFKNAIQANAEGFRIERGYPKNWRVVAREEAEKSGKKFY